MSSSDMLRAARLTGAVFFSGRYTAPYGIKSTRRFDPAMPMAHLRHVSVFHLADGRDLHVRDRQAAAAAGSPPAIFS